MSEYFSKPYRHVGRNATVKLDLSNYAKKVDLEGATGADTSNVAAKSDLV